MKILTSKATHVYWVHSAGARFSNRFPWGEKVWSPPLILLIKWKTQWATHIKTASLHTHTHTVTKWLSMGNYTEFQHPTLLCPLMQCNHTPGWHATCCRSRAQISKGMFYLKGRTLIQRHHTSTEKKCCLISVTPVLLLSSDRERRRCATLATQTSSLLRS